MHACCATSAQSVREVRVPAGLEGLDGLVIPGGESTTMTLGIEREGLADPLRELVRSGTPVLGTCAGMIMLDREHLGLADYSCRRNAFGRQIHSFEADLEIPGIHGEPVRAVFIRAPWIDQHGAAVEVLAEVDGHIVAARQDNMLVISFHPEIAGETQAARALHAGRGAVTTLTLHFVRHGESLANDADRSGRPRPADWDALSERGWEQARGLGRRLEGQRLELIVASTMRRAQETAEGISEVLRLPVETDPDLHELRQSDAFYESGGTFGDTASLNWMPGAPRDFAEPGAESFEQMLGRVVRVRERMEARAGDERILLVSHYGFIHFFLGHALFGEAFGPEHLIPLWYAGHANTGISVFERRNRRMDGMDFDGWHLMTWNDRAHV